MCLLFPEWPDVLYVFFFHVKESQLFVALCYFEACFDLEILLSAWQSSLINSSFFACSQITLSRLHNGPLTHSAITIQSFSLNYSRKHFRAALPRKVHMLRHRHLPVSIYRPSHNKHCQCCQRSIRAKRKGGEGTSKY